MRALFKGVLNHEFGEFPHMKFDHALHYYGIDKPDLRFEMKFADLTAIAKNKDFKVFNDAETVVGFPAAGMLEYSKKQLKELEDLAKSQICGGTGLFWVKVENMFTFFSQLQLLILTFMSQTILTGGVVGGEKVLVVLQRHVCPHHSSSCRLNIMLFLIPRQVL